MMPATITLRFGARRRSVLPEAWKLTASSISGGTARIDSQMELEEGISAIVGNGISPRPPRATALGCTPTRRTLGPKAL